MTPEERMKGMTPAARLALAQVLACRPEEGDGSYLRSADNRWSVPGLLCEAYRQRTGKGKWIAPTTDALHGIPAYRFAAGQSRAAEMPDAVRIWAGLTDDLSGITFTQARVATGG